MFGKKKKTIPKAMTKEALAGKIYDLERELQQELNTPDLSRERAIDVLIHGVGKQKGFTKKDLVDIYEALTEKQCAKFYAERVKPFLKPISPEDREARWQKRQKEAAKASKNKSKAQSSGKKAAKAPKKSYTTPRKGKMTKKDLGRAKNTVRQLHKNT